MNKLVITPKEEKDVTMTIRIDKALQEKYNELSAKTNRSRNELIGLALQYALENMEIKEWNYGKSKAVLWISNVHGTALLLILN